MSNLEFVSNYSPDDTRREQLYPLFERVFGISVDVLKDFYARGFWNPTYRPYTLFEGERAVANSSMFSMPLIVQGRLIQAAGIQSVMTDPDQRGKGLMKQTFTRMLADIDQEFESAFLITDSPELYTPFGFRTLQEFYFVASVAHEPQAGDSLARKLEFFYEEDLSIVRGLFEGHVPVSQRFAPVSHQSSFYLNMYSPSYNEKLYHAADLNVLLVFEVEDDTLKLYDVVGAKLPSLEQLCSQIPASFSKIEFYFSPDQFNIVSEPVRLDATRSRLMVRGRFDVEDEPLTFPITAAF